MKIAVDCDDVLAEFIPALAEWHNEKYNTRLKKEDFHSFTFCEVWGGSYDEAVEKVKQSFREKGVLDMNVIGGAFGVLKKLKGEGHELQVVTSRFEFVKEETEVWLDKHFEGLFEDVHFGHNSYSDEGKSLSKAEQCEALGFDLLIDDLAEHARACSEKGIKVILFDEPWNQDVGDSDMVKRVRGWDDVLEAVRGMS